jgi:hypothetical protein
MFPGLQVLRIYGILVESSPLLKLLLGKVMSFFGIPSQHFRLVLQADRFAVFAQDSLWIVKHVIGVDEADLDLAGGCALDIGIVLTANARSDQPGRLQVVEESAQLVIAGFFWHEVWETSLSDQRRNGATVVAGDR